MKIGGRPEPVSVTNGLDDLWIVVIRQSSLEIAGSPRNMFWHGLKGFWLGVELLDGC